MFPKRDQEGTTTGSSGSGSPAAPPTPPAEPPQAPPATNTGQQPSATPEQPSAIVQGPPGFVPVESLRAVTAERDRLAAEARQRTEDEQKAKGEWESVATKREQERDEWKTRFTSVARRSAFIAKIGPQVPDAEAAYKLAHADGLLDKIDVDNDGNANAGHIDEAVKKTLETYKSIFGKSASFGGERSGQQPETGKVPDDIGGRERARRYYESNPSGRR